MQLPISTRRVVVAAGVVLVLGGSAVGIASAQSAPATPTSQQSGYQKFVDALAQKLGVSSQTLQQDIQQVRQEQGLNGNAGFPGRGPRGPRGGFGPGVDVQAAAQAIGISVQQLHTELQGKSLTQVAQAHNKNPDDVATALKNAAHTRIDQAAANNRLNGADPNTLKSRADQRIDQLMTQTVPQRGQGGAGPGRGAFGFGPGVIQQGLDVAAQAIGISTQQLQTELQGKSLTQVAQAHNKNPNDVATALKNAAHTRIDQAAANNRLNGADPNTLKSQIDQRIDQLMNQTMPQRGTRTRGDQGDATSGA